MNLLLYTNILTPYRKYLYDLIYEECRKRGDHFTVLVMSDSERNRVWHYRDYSTSYTRLLNGNTLSIGETYIHFNRGLKKILLDIKPSVVIASGGYLCPGNWTIANLKNRLGYKALFWNESHLGESRSFGSLKMALREKIRSEFFVKFDGFLYPGKLSKDFIAAYANEGVQYIFLPNLVDESIYLENPVQERVKDATKDYFMLFTPARLSIVKGIAPFMDLLSKCNGKGKVVYKIAGDGDLKDLLKKKAEELDLNVEFLGNKRPEEVAELYKQCDGFVLPSLSDPNPLSCIEALWSGKPLLVSNHVGNYPEVIREGENGYVFSYESEMDAIHKIERFINMSPMWEINAQRISTSIAQEVYSSEKAVCRMIDEIEKLR